MIFRRIIEALYHQPLAITRQGFDSIDAIVRPRVFDAKGSFDVNAGRFEVGKTDLWGEPLPEMLQIDEHSGIATLNITGPLIQHAELIEKSCGACSYDDIRENLKLASNRGDISGIFLNINSPGGQCVGCIETSEMIAAIQERMPIVGFGDTCICSAAYSIAAGCTAIYSTKSTFVGSIGTIMGFLDTTKAHEMAGLKPEIFTSGKLKAAGSDGVPITDEQRKYLQGLVDAAFDQFRGHVLAYRNISDEDMEGQAFYGTQAEKSGVIDGLVLDEQEAYDRLVELIG